MTLERHQLREAVKRIVLELQQELTELGYAPLVYELGPIDVRVDIGKWLIDVLVDGSCTVPGGRKAPLITCRSTQNSHVFAATSVPELMHVLDFLSSEKAKEMWT